MSYTFSQLSRCAMSTWLVFSLSSGAALAATVTKTSYAKVEVKLEDPKLVKQAEKIRTLYISLYDAASPMPRPFGAMKVELAKDVKGVVYTGELTTENIVLMSDSPAPKKLRIKARLDKDGSAGTDEAGDLVGIVDQLSLGDKATIVINKAI